MTRRRDTLHHTKVDEFLCWVQTQGYGLLQTKGIYESFRIEHPDQGELLIGHKRDRSDHVTTTGRLTALVGRWQKARETSANVTAVI